MRKIKDRIVTSRHTLPWTSVAVAVVWLMVLSRVQQPLMAAAPLSIALITLLTAVLNNRNVLMHIYSRMPSATFLVMTCAAIPFFINAEGIIGLIAVGLVMVCYLLMFKTYQDKCAPEVVMSAFSFISLASILCPQLLWLAPLLWLTLSIRMMALSLRNTVATLLGLALPFWLGIGIMVLLGKDLNFFYEWQLRLTSVGPWLDFSGWQPIDKVAAGFIALLYVVGSLHFPHAGSSDSIRTRMCYHVFITIGGCAALVMALQPQTVGWTLPLLMANTSFLIGHAVTFSRSRLSTILFFLAVATAIGITVCHLWMLL